MFKCETVTPRRIKIITEYSADDMNKAHVISMQKPIIKCEELISYLHEKFNEIPQQILKLHDDVQ